MKPKSKPKNAPAPKQYPKPRLVSLVLKETMHAKAYDPAQFERQIAEIEQQISKFLDRARFSPERNQSAAQMLKMCAYLRSLDVFSSERLNTERATDFALIAKQKLKAPFVPEPSIAGLQLTADWFVELGGLVQKRAKNKSGIPSYVCGFNTSSKLNW